MKDWLLQHQISYRALAAITDQSASSISKKVNGIVPWQQDDLEIFYHEFGLSADFVLGFSPKPAKCETTNERILF